MFILIEFIQHVLSGKIQNICSTVNNVHQNNIDYWQLLENFFKHSDFLSFVMEYEICLP